MLRTCKRSGTYLRQRGVVLLIALIALAAMTLAAVSLVRTMDTGNTILGNLAFKDDTIHASDTVIEAARTWLNAQTPSTLNNDGTSGSGYYSSTIDSVDLMGTNTPADTSDDVNWDGTCSACTVVARQTDANGAPLKVNGMSAAYLVSRLCRIANTTVTDPNQSCRTSLTTTAATSQQGGVQGGGYQVPGAATSLQPYYRIIVRVTGPRNTVSYVEAVVL